MALDTNFNVNPYNDDFDDAQKYYRLLFKPGYAVQARELTQIQSVLQKQVNRFGNHIFKNGSLVTGGEFFIHKAKYVKVEDNYLNADVSIDEFENKTVYSNELRVDDRPTKRGQVIKVYDKNLGNGDPKTLLIAPIYGDDFTESEVIRTRETDVYLTTSTTSLSIGTGSKVFVVDTGLPYITGQTVKLEESNISNYMIGTVVSYNSSNGQMAINSLEVGGSGGTFSSWTINVEGVTGSFGADVYANTVSANASGDCLLFSVAEGVFYYDGFFIRNDPQTIAISKYSYNDANASAKIGFEIIESVVNSSEDSSLLDPAQDASNYQAPGSDRYKIELVLAARDLESTDENKFIELMRVENGVILSQNKFPVYSVLEDTFARRTYDESGNYTVRPFKLSLETNSSNTANLDIILSPGKGYVFGYEFETISPTTIVVDKPRTTGNSINEYETAEYGYFVYTTQHRNCFPINTLETVNLHCLPANTGATFTIDESTAATISNTKIGTARIKTVEYDYSANNLNANTYVYRTYLFDVQINSSITGNLFTATSNTVWIGNTCTIPAQTFSIVEDAYKGAKLRILSGPGSNELPKLITAFNAANQICTLAESFTNLPANNAPFSIDFDVGNIKSLAGHSGNTRLYSGNVAEESKEKLTGYEYTTIQQRNKEPLIFKIGQDYVKANSIQDLTYTYKRLYGSVSFSSGSAVLSSIGGTAQELASSEPSDYYVTVVNKNSSSFFDGQVIPYNLISVNRELGTITITGAADMTAKVFAPVIVLSGTQSSEKTKQLITANVSNVSILSGETDVFANGSALVYPSDGVTVINNSLVNKVPNVPQSLYVADVISITKVVDIGNTVFSESNVSSGTDITSSYTLDNGQRDSFYDHSSIRLKPRTTAPSGNIAVFYNRFKTFNNDGSFFSVDSYSDINYEDIPTYTSPANNIKYELRDCLDYRPVLSDGAFTFNVLSGSSQSGPGIPQVSSGIELEYEYYLPRIDKIVLNKDKTFKVVKGIPSLNPLTPKDIETGMTLYILTYAPYVGSIKDVQVRTIENKRYTMRDIGKIEKRLENLEYYTALSLTEQQTLSQQDYTILDSQNLPRFKNGILVDTFTGFSASDVENADYTAAIDSDAKELVASQEDVVYKLTFNDSTSSNFKKRGSLLLKDFTDVEFINQSKASLSINVNPFNVLKYEGHLSLHPDNDVWVDTERQPSSVVDLTGDLSGWNLIANNAFRRNASNWTSHWFGISNPAARQQVGVEQRTITTTTVSPERVTVNIGDRVVDVSIIPYMRTIYVASVTTGMKSDTAVYSFFDNTSISEYFLPANKLILDKSIGGLVKDYRNSNESFLVTIKSKTNSTNFANLEGIYVSENIIHITGGSITTNWNGGQRNPFANVSDIYIEISSFSLVSPLPNTPAVQLVGGNIRANVVSYTHQTDYYTNKGTNTVSLRGSHDFTGAENASSLVGKQIILINDFAANFPTFTSTITDYYPSNNVVKLAANIPSTFPASFGMYHIGDTKTDIHGTVCGHLYIPGGKFRTGDKSFRLIDSPLNDIGSASSWGDTKFFTQGILQTVEATRVSVVQMRTTTTSTIETQPIYYDPLAQTFAVDPQVYPRGMFISKVRLCFKTKDDVRPVRLQIRPTVNGYPSSTEIYPYSTVELAPSSVNATDTPSLTDSSKYTEFVFESPVYLLPGEHSIVLISDSNKYEIYAAEMGGVDLITGNRISDQPYGGSLFKSQNARTWTPEQNIDMMFGLYRCQFNTGATVIQFLTKESAITANQIQSSANSNTIVDITQDHLYDIACVGVTDLDFSGATIKYEFKSLNEAETIIDFKEITPRVNYEMNDGSGRRLISKTLGNTSFILKATLNTTFSDVSPVIKWDNTSLHAAKNIINNLELSEEDIVIENAGSGYSGNTTVTISGGGGSGANAYAVVENSNVVSVIFDDYGTGYTETPTITVSGAATSNCVVSYNGETSKSGGNSNVRHLTKTVTLADGFDSGDLRVYLTAYKPSNSNILVYYKIISDSDPETLADKTWKLMTQIGPGNVYSSNRKEYREIVYAPGTDGTPDNRVEYDGFTSFKTFQIKVVLSCVDPTNPPRVSDLRVIALPEGSV